MKMKNTAVSSKNNDIEELLKQVPDIIKPHHNLHDERMILIGMLTILFTDMPVPYEMVKYLVNQHLTEADGSPMTPQEQNRASIALLRLNDMMSRQIHK